MAGAVIPTIGLVSPTAVPFTAHPLGSTTFHITTSVGRTLQTYDLRKGLNLVFLTRPQTPGPITATSTWDHRLIASWSTSGPKPERGLWIFQRGKKTGEFLLPPTLDEDIVQIVVYGSWIVACCTTKIEVWQSATLEHHTTLQTPFIGGKGSILTGGIAIMPTFTNKVFAGRENGSVEIWNIATGKLIYSIVPPSSDLGPVSALEPTPALSLLAIAYANGPLMIHDVRTDREVLRLNAGHGGQAPITSMSFRTDDLGAGPDGQQAGIMATASYNSGDVQLWDLNNGGKRTATLRGAHTTSDTGEDGISKIEFLSGQAVLVTSGADNSLKTWIFDQTPFSPLPRPLHARGGHSAPITTLNFLPSEADGTDANGKWLFSAAKDRSAWGWSLRRDGQSTELSQGSVKSKAKKLGMMSSIDSRGETERLKAPEITCMSCSMNRDGGMGAMPGHKTIWASAKQLKGKSTATDPNMTGWESVITGHRGDRFARTWFWGRKRAGRWLLETSDGGEVTSVAVSPCGTFAILGSSRGIIDMYNLQSGLHRQRFPTKLTKAQAHRLDQEHARQALQNGEVKEQFAKGLGKHQAAVTGVEVDSLNRYVISCSVDGKIKFWDFLNGRLLHELDWSAYTSAHGLKLHRTSNLLSLSCGDKIIRVVDIETRRVVRELSGLRAAVNDWTFSHDGRWILAASRDALVNVWDLPTGHLIDAIRLPSPCTALSMSPTGEYLATTQEDSVGVDLWTNRTLFRHVPTRAISEAEFAQVSAPAASGEGGASVVATALEGAEDIDQNDEYDALDPLPIVDQLTSSVETLSLVPRSRWQNLIHLDQIRERNKPIEPPKAPEKAPFFLSLTQRESQQGEDQSLATLTSGDDALDSNMGATASSRILKMNREANQSDLSKFSRDGVNEKAFNAATDHLKNLSPSAIDIEIRSLDAAPPYAQLLFFVQALTHKMRERKDYELVQAWMAVFLKVHADAIAEDVEASTDEENANGGQLVNALRAWREEQKKEAGRLDALAGYCTGVVGFLRSAR
ncbi:MAG: hypothetical protein Q9159_002152 [Coniocarpon cinnabarinum]